MPAMHALHVIQRYYPYTGGSELYFQEIGEALVREGHRVTVLTTDAWDLDHFWAAGRRTLPPGETQHNGVRIVRFPVVRAPGPPLVYPLLRRMMVELGRLPGSTALLRRLALLTPRVPGLVHYLATTREHYDLVHTTNITLDFTIIPALRFAQRRGIPHLCTPFVHLGEPGSHAIVRYYAQPHQLDLLRRAARVIVQTGREGDFLAARGVPRERLRLVGCWVRPDQLAGGDGARFRREQGIAGPIVLSIGVAAYDKGTPHTIEAMQRLWQAGCDATLVLIASNTMAQFEAWYAGLPDATRQRIRLLRSAPHQVKLDALAAADVFALPSRTDSFGIVYLEAWCYALPVIGAWAGGVPDVIRDGEDGFLVRFGDVEALAERLALLLGDPQRARAMGRRGRQRVLEHFTFEQRYARMRQVYREVGFGAP